MPTSFTGILVTESQHADVFLNLCRTCEVLSYDKMIYDVITQRYYTAKTQAIQEIVITARTTVLLQTHGAPKT